VLIYATKNYLFFFLLEVQFVKLHCVYLQLCHIVIAVSRACRFWQLVWLFLW